MMSPSYPIPANVIRHLADNAILRRVTTVDAIVRDLGAKVRFTPDDQYQALMISDNGCRWPGCTTSLVRHRPPHPRQRRRPHQPRQRSPLVQPPPPRTPIRRPNHRQRPRPHPRNARQHTHPLPTQTPSNPGGSLTLDPHPQPHQLPGDHVEQPSGGATQPGCTAHPRTHTSGWLTDPRPASS